jgi:hypothetical protein
MSALDIAKDIVRIGSTAGLSKDVIDLLEKKATLLAEQNADLARQLSVAHLKIATLETEVGDLSGQLYHPKPIRELSEDQKKVLLHLMQSDAGLTVEEIAQSIGGISSMARHHCEELAGIGFVAQTRFRGEHRRIDGPDWGFALTKEGRKWIAQQSA